ncbi:type I restriction enzyme, S subunit [Halopseudomonas litoralis]|uniref:Type I restriction enzyme, S subunit n=1 Tax=Halopseudomonas litoralis TaxID=797277 RepID=A0A1H1WMQ2_9GAMM|nr:type I restriction enzyme, S subunit [Halopseudomonas litoralis]
MRSEWTEVTLTDIYTISSGLSKPAKDFGSGYPFLAFKDVFYNTFVPDELSQLVQSNEKEQAKCSIKRGDVFLTRTSETMDCSGQLIPDTVLSFSSATAGASPPLKAWGRFWL